MPALILGLLLCAAAPAAAQFLQQGEKLVASDSAGFYPPWQGYSVAISADGNTALVGGPNFAQKGGAWVYTRSGTSWTQQSLRLYPSDASSSPSFGYSVALSADGNTALIGGYQNSSGGGAWVFTRDGSGNWTQQSNRLTGGPGTSSGVAVALSADGKTALVGGPNDNGSRGAVWVFVKDDSSEAWTQQGDKLVGSGYISRPYFGSALATSADGNTAAIGGRDERGPAGGNVGGTWIFTRDSNGVWTQQGDKLIGTGYTADSRQGGSLALSADGNTLLVGAFGENSGIGAAWYFTRGDGGSWTQQGEKIVPTDFVGSSTNFGVSASLSADGNVALIGGAYDNFGPVPYSDYGGAVGATWVFTRAGNSWTQIEKLIGSGATTAAKQGISVALAADGDTAIIGGFADNWLGDSVGSVGASWVFYRNKALQVSPQESLAATLIEGQTSPSGAFGYELSSSGGNVPYLISGTPSWLLPAFTFGTVPPTVTVGFIAKACGLKPGDYSATIDFAHTGTDQSAGTGNTTREATLTVVPGEKDDCKGNGWKDFVCSPGPFKNQGQCVSYFAKRPPRVAHFSRWSWFWPKYFHKGPKPGPLFGRR